MPAPSASSKVLRVALVRDGRVVTERLLDPERALTIGHQPTNALVIDHDALGASTALMSACDDGYVLHARAALRGKVTVHGTPHTLTGEQDLVLDRTDRGKLVIRDLTVLFQFVSPPPATGRFLGAPLDFRPQLMDDDDPVFVGTMGVLTALAAVMLGFVYVSPAPAVAAVVDVDQRMLRVMAQAPVVLPDPEPIDVDAPVPTDAPEPAPSQQPAAPSGDAPATSDDDAEPQSIWIDMIGSIGADADNPFARITGELDHSAHDLDEALQAVSGVQVAVADAGPRRLDGPGCQGCDVDIDDLDDIRTGPSEPLEATPDMVPEVTLSTPELDVDVTDAEGIQVAVHQYDGRILSCYERALNRDPTLAGRVELEFVVRDGRADPVHIFADTTGDATFTDCLATAFRRMRFPSGASGEVLYPVVFSPSP